MKLKFAVMLAPALALGVLAVSVEAQQHKATRLGNPATRFAKKPPKKADDVRVLLRSEKTKADVAEVLKNLNEVSKKKSLSFREKKMYDRAKYLIVSEVAIVKNIPELEAEKVIEKALDKSLGLAGVVGAGGH